MKTDDYGYKTPETLDDLQGSFAMMTYVACFKVLVAEIVSLRDRVEALEARQ